MRSTAGDEACHAHPPSSPWAPIRCTASIPSSSAKSAALKAAWQSVGVAVAASFPTRSVLISTVLSPTSILVMWWYHGASPKRFLNAARKSASGSESPLQPPAAIAMALRPATRMALPNTGRLSHKRHKEANVISETRHAYRLGSASMRQAGPELHFCTTPLGPMDVGVRGNPEAGHTPAEAARAHLPAAPSEARPRATMPRGSCL